MIHLALGPQFMFGFRLAQDDEGNYILEIDFAFLIILYAPYSSHWEEGDGPE